MRAILAAALALAGCGETGLSSGGIYDLSPAVVDGTAVGGAPDLSAAGVEDLAVAIGPDLAPHAPAADLLDGCRDGVRDGAETDVDCGGPGRCARCAAGTKCLADSDCATFWCGNGVCLVPNCMDHLKNGLETAIDCGGPTCPKCPLGNGCKVDADCTSGWCMGAACGCTQSIQCPPAPCGPPCPNGRSYCPQDVCIEGGCIPGPGPPCPP